MSKIAKAMADWLTYPAGQDALTYIETGDPAALRRIRRHSGGLFVPWVYHLTSAMADPDAMGDHDRRALRALVAMEAFDQIGSWLSEALGRAKGEESLHDLVRDELAEARVPAVMISAMTVAYVPNLVRAGRPSSAGRHLLSLSDADFAAAVKAAASLNQGIAQRDSFPRLADFLLGFAPERLGPLIPAMEMTPGLAEVILRKGADRVKPAAVDRLFELLGHKNKGDREAAARALGRIGAEVVPRAAGMLEDRKADKRATAVLLLATAGTPEALQTLERRLDEESDDDIRDAMLLALDSALAASGREVDRAEVERRVQRTAPKLQVPVADWLDESRLPDLRYRDGDPLNPEATRYLLYRQSRAKEVRPDVEARPLYALIDRATSGDFALEVFRQFAASNADAKDRWALAIAGLLGDDRLVPILNRSITTWADSSRVKMAESAVQALALLGTDAALMSLDAAAIRYRVKNKKIGAAAQETFAATAERLGLTVDELGDRVVPWLGFEPGQPRVIGPEGKRIEVAIGPDFKLRYRDIEKNKAVASLPRSLPKETLDEFKEMGATLREVARAQKLRLETLMVRQFRWPVPRWRELFLGHPVLFLPLGTRLVWGHYDESGALRATFRALGDRTLTDAADEPFDLLETGSVGIVHPLELDDETLGAWRTHLADYEVEAPFPQLERPVIRVSDERRATKISRELVGTSLGAMTFRGRAEKLGWANGSVTDRGGVDFYRKVFPGAGVEAFLGLEGMWVALRGDESIELQGFYFVKSGLVRVGSYVRDNPSDESDDRLIAFGAVPPLVYSEVMGDLKRIAGQSGEEGADSREE